MLRLPQLFVPALLLSLSCQTTTRLGGFPYVALDPATKDYTSGRERVVRFQHCWSPRTENYFDGLREAAAKQPGLLALQDFAIYQESAYCLIIEGIPVTGDVQ